MAAAVYYYSNYDDYSTRNYGHLEGWLAVGHLILHSSRWWNGGVKPWASTFSFRMMEKWRIGIFLSSLSPEQDRALLSGADTKKITGGMSFPLFLEEIFKHNKQAMRNKQEQMI